MHGTIAPEPLLPRVLYLDYPLAPITFLEFHKIDPARDERDETPKPPPCFACRECHGVRYLSRMNRDPWNVVVSYLSGGLLYGKEVKRPSWFTRDRKRAFRPQVMRAPSQRRPQVLERLMRGWKYARIGADLGISEGTVETHVRNLCRQYAVKRRAELENAVLADQRQAPARARRRASATDAAASASTQPFGSGTVKL